MAGAWIRGGGVRVYIVMGERVSSLGGGYAAPWCDVRVRVMVRVWVGVRVGV